MKPIFSQNAKLAISAAVKEAGALGHTCIGSEHILLGILKQTECGASKLLKKFGIDHENVRADVKERLGSGAPTELTEADQTERFRAIIERAAYECAKRGGETVGTRHFLLSILLMGNCEAARSLVSLGADISQIGKALIDDMNLKHSSAPANAENKNSGKTLSNLENLSKFGRDLTALAKEGKLDPVIGRETETERLIQILSRRTKNNPCLIGEPGVGKTAVVEGLAIKIASENIPETLKDKSIVSLDVSAMIAGTKYRGEFEERMKGVMEEVMQNNNIILFIDEIHTIVGAGSTGESSMDAANIIKPALSRGELQVIGATTISEYRKYIEKDAALERRFQSVNVGEPSPEDAVKILLGLRPKYEAHHGLKITDEAIEASVQLSRR